jgi:hypothetical protein
VGRLYFAGEHCSVEAHGFMEGGCETGEAAARQILHDLGMGREEVAVRGYTGETIARLSMFSRQRARTGAAERVAGALP